MSIEAIRSDKGQPRANCICDKCTREEVIPCNHERRRGMPDAVNQGQVIKKLTQGGWSYVKGKLLCPACEAKRKSYEHEKSKHVVPERWANGFPENWHNVRGHIEMKATEKTENIIDIRQPTRDQKRDIRAALDLHYDLKSERYIGGETDATIAKMIGGGCMPGWVTAEREDGYGPDGGNDDIAKVTAEIIAMQGRIDAAERKAACAAADVEKAQSEVTAIKTDLAAAIKSIAVIKVAVGPRAARA